jgi:hypothetical protein
MLRFREASRSFEPRHVIPIHVSVAVKFPAVTSRYHGAVREISKVTRNERGLKHTHVKYQAVKARYIGIRIVSKSLEAYKYLVRTSQRTSRACRKSLRIIKFLNIG